MDGQSERRERQWKAVKSISDSRWDILNLVRRQYVWVNKKIPTRLAEPKSFSEEKTVHKDNKAFRWVGSIGINNDFGCNMNKQFILGNILY